MVPKMYETKTAGSGCAVKLTHMVLSIGLLLGLLTLPASSRAVEPSTDHDVVIVGAGAAGLYAAYELTNLGFDVLVVEASDRHGGRIWSDTLGDVRIEHGAEVLYGVQNNFVFNDIKAEYGAGAHVQIFREDSVQDTLLSMDGGSTCWVATGDCDLDSDIYDYWDFYYDIDNHANDPTDETVADHMDTVLGVNASHRAYHLYEARSPAGEYGTTVERLGLRSLARERALWALSSAVYGLQPTGYLDALNTLYFNSILSKVLLNSPVTVVDTSGIKPVAIDTNGVYHYADAIIVTVSLGVLQAEIIDFIPDLPAAKIAAYTTIGMGKGMKMSLRFVSQFWDSKMMDVTTEGPTAECWVPTKYQPAATDHVLTCSIMGKNAEAMTALANDTARIIQALSDLDEAFSNAATPAFISGVIQDWTSEPYVLGSFAYPTVGSYPGGLSMREVLAQPVGTTVYFAGEATDNGNSGTVPGALQSGERAAGEHNTAAGGPPAVGAPTSKFTASVTSGDKPLDVDFTDLSSQVPTGWSWNFGDSGTSDDQHASHQYTTAGTYSVSLTSSNASGSHTRVFPNLISVSEPSGLPPLNITEPQARTVVIWIDNEVGDPSSVGNDLEYAYNGSWTSDGTTGTIVVDKDDVISRFAISGLPGTPTDTANWSDLTLTITIATGAITSLSQTGTVAISGLGNQPFSYDLNTVLFDAATSNSYTQTGFADVAFGPETVTGWCTDTNAGQISGLACPAYDGPIPFPYSSITGRFNAIGATDLNSIIYMYSTFGDAQLFEVDTDGDGLLDYVETNTGTYVSPTDTGTDPLVADTDGDGLEDGEEVATVGTDPTNEDSDGDLVCDGSNQVGSCTAAGPDNCPVLDSLHSSQTNSDSFTAGDHCQCGDVDGSGDITVTDTTRAREHLVARTLSGDFFKERCNVTGPSDGGATDCNVADVFLIDRASKGGSVSIEDTCAAYTTYFGPP